MGSIYGETGKEREERCLVPRIPDDATYIDLDELEVTDSEEEPMRNRSNHRRFRLQDIYARPVLHSSRPQNNNSIGIRNPPIVAPLVLLSSFRFQDRKLWAGKTTVELGAGEYAGDFLRITHIIEDVSSGELVLRGQRFRRNRNVDHMLINKLNEVCLCLEIDVDDPRTSEEQSAVQVPLSDILTIRRLNLTNLKFPLGQDHHRVVSEQHISRKAKQKRVEAEGLLICRWKLSISYATAADRLRNKFMSNTLERLTASEITIDDRRVTESDTRIQWRGETVLGGSYRPAPQAEVTALSSTKTRSQKRTRSFSEQAVSEKTLEPVTPQISPRQLATPPHSSRPRVGNANSDSFRTPQRQLSNRSVQARTAEGLLTGFRGRGPLFGPASISARGSVSLIQKLTTHDSPSRRLVQDLARVPRGISSFASDLSTAPLSGVLRSSRSSACWTTRPRLPDQMFTYGDGFCGSGGATRGAWMAGLKVIWGFDFDELACASWRANFTNAECYQMAAHNFIDQANASETRRRAIEVDILHCSCPCQFYSSAHTRAGPNDEMNTASLFATHDLIKVVKPRIVTFEQTFGILAAAHRQYFCSLIHMLTELNFSVRWEVVQFQNWGVPARRRRLIIIASCPGEILPEIPAATHAEYPSRGSSLKPYTTANQALNSIRGRSVLDHDTRSVTYSPSQHRAPWDGDKILTRCLTTSGAGPYSHHPSGSRGLTVREYAVLQSYSQDHIFCGSRTQQIKQIGNSVPVSAANVLFSSIRKQLEKADGIVEPAIIIDSDDEDDQGTRAGMRDDPKRIARDRKTGETKRDFGDDKDVIILDD